MVLNYTLFWAAIFAVGACSDAKAADDDIHKAASEAGGDESAEHIPKMVAVHAAYCSVCHEMKPLVDRIASKCDKKTLEIDVVDVADEDEEHLIDDYSIVALPTYLFIDADGHEVARLVGAQTDSTIEQALAVLTGRQCPGLGRVKKDDGHSDNS